MVMQKQITAVNEYRKTTMSLVNAKARILRMAGTCIAYMIGTGQLTQGMSWESFIEAFSSPAHVVGLLGVLFASGSTSGGKK